MGRAIRDVMTKNPVCVPKDTTISDAAKKMRDSNAGALIIEDKGQLSGIVTDRDFAVRAVANDEDPKRTPVSKICSGGDQMLTVSPESSMEDAVKLMRQKAIRRIPVVENGKPVGIISLGDLALVMDPKSALAEISAAPPNR